MTALLGVFCHWLGGLASGSFLLDSSSYQAWQGSHGGKDLAQVAAAYRRFVAAGVAQPPESPLAAMVDQWLLGSSPFVERIRRRARDPTYRDEVPHASPW